MQQTFKGFDVASKLHTSLRCFCLLFHFLCEVIKWSEIVYFLSSNLEYADAKLQVAKRNEWCMQIVNIIRPKAIKSAVKMFLFLKFWFVSMCFIVTIWFDMFYCFLTIFVPQKNSNRCSRFYTLFNAHFQRSLPTEKNVCFSKRMFYSKQMSGTLDR